MQFDKIRILEGSGRPVELEWTEPLNESKTDRHALAGKEPPSGAFKDALQAFDAFVVTLIGAPGEWLHRLVVRSLSLKQDDDGRRGLQVSAVLTVPAAANRGVSITTPYLMAPPATYEGDGTGFLSDFVLALIDNIEECAEAYIATAATPEQLELEPIDLTEPVHAIDCNMGVDCTCHMAERVDAERLLLVDHEPPARRTRLRGDKEVAVPGVGTVLNPTATVAVATDEALRVLLLDAGRDVPAAAIKRWTSHERAMAQAWAEATWRAAAGRVPAASVPDEPPHVVLDATLPLVDDAG